MTSQYHSHISLYVHTYNEGSLRTNGTRDDMRGHSRSRYHRLRLRSLAGKPQRAGPKSERRGYPEPSPGEVCYPARQLHIQLRDDIHLQQWSGNRQIHSDRGLRPDQVGDGHRVRHELRDGEHTGLVQGTDTRWHPRDASAGSKPDQLFPKGQLRRVDNNQAAHLRRAELSTWQHVLHKNPRAVWQHGGLLPGDVAWTSRAADDRDRGKGWRASYRR